MSIVAPVLRLQVASLYASGDGSTFTGTGGPFGFSPWTSQFGGVVSSAGLAGEPFADTVNNVAAGDEVTFVVAVQNMTAGAAAYGVTLRGLMPAGFAVPTEGLGLSVTDGAGTDLSTSGDLFGAGLQIGAPINGYDPDSGLNVVLLTYSLLASTSLPGPNTDIAVTTNLLSYSGSPGGSNLAGPTPASVHTDVISAAPTPSVVAETDPSAVAKGQTVAFDVSLALPVGTMRSLRLASVLPGGGAFLDMVSTSVVGLGAGLVLGAPQLEADGSVLFGTVTAGAVPGAAAPTAAGDTITLRVVVRADGTASGPATLQTVVSAADPGSPGGVWSATVASSVGVIVPPPPPQLSGLSGGLAATTATNARPFATLSIADGDPNQAATLAITLGDSFMGRLTAGGAGHVDAAGSTFSVSGTLASVQAAARQVVFVPATAGVEAFTVTVVDAVGGVGQDGSTRVSISQPTSPDPLFDPVYYLAHNPDVAAARVDPYMHYMTFGWREGRNPDAFFDTRYYETSNPDVAAAGVNPLQHFEQHGWQEGRQPSLVFSDAWYLEANPDVKAAGVDPLLHYVQFGMTEGRQAVAPGYDGNPGGADPLVDAARIDAQLGATLVVPGAAGQAQASEMYHRGGWQSGLSPDAWFDPAYYLTQNPDVRAAGVDPLAHFEQFGWREGRDPSLLFSDAQYLAANPDVAAAGVDPLLQYVTAGQAAGRASFVVGGVYAADLLVDPAFYDGQLGATLLPPGVLAAEQAAFAYDTGGWQKGLNPDRLFDTDYYLSHNPDVAAAHVNPLMQYESVGWREGRDPSAQFSTTKYLAANPDVAAANMNPLLHYVAFGQSEGRAAYSV